MKFGKAGLAGQLFSRRIVKGSIAIASLATAFIGWGALGNLFADNTQQASPVPAPASTLSDLRKALLPDASKSKKKDGEFNIILNDPFMKERWGLAKTDARRAWDVSQGSKDIIVAVIDTGIDIHHKDLDGNIFSNPGEKCGNGIDDDKNGYVDDCHGWNFVHNNGDLTDNHGHGTHIAGIIGAKAHDTSGVSGVAPNVSLMMLKYYDPKASNSNNLKNTVAAIRYAIKMKETLKRPMIINYSGGGAEYSAEEYAAVKDAEKAGILFVAAAGNERSNSDEVGKHYYPADYQLSNIISVTAVNKEDTKVLPSSNYGVRTVDIAAPGENIRSTLPGNAMGDMTGTSQATAFATGVAVLVMAHNRDFTAADVKKYILRTGDEYPTLISKTGTAKLLNSYKALTSLDKGVSATGVVASNTAGVGTRTFSSEQNLKDPKFNTSALRNSASEDDEEPAEAIAMFGKDLLKAMQKDPSHAEPEVRKP
jgi:subtilisin family serine protease